MLCSAFMHVETSACGRPVAFRLDRSDFDSPHILSPRLDIMASAGADSAYAAAWADFAEAAGLEVAGGTTSKSPPTTSSWTIRNASWVAEAASGGRRAHCWAGFHYADLFHAAAACSASSSSTGYSSAYGIAPTDPGPSPAATQTTAAMVPRP